MVGLDPEALGMVLEAIGEFAHSELPAQKLLEFDRNDQVPLDVLRAMCSEKLGIQLLFIPTEYEGMGGGTFDVYRVCEAMAHIDLGVATGVLATFLGSDPIVVGGTPEQKKHWLTRIGNEGLLFAYGATEPEAGSDLAALKTTARRIEEDGHVEYVINGEKQWISNGGVADAYSILATAPGGPTWFVVE
ncbi:MAG TPA: acyl-CoA dehydrogenase family protein, partial [Acidimicrobiales bacterium]|nr:acyl-CoA dehydrogenase family protein [Acidimicrobiales bacterium]